MPATSTDVREMKTIRFHGYGEPSNVLHLEAAAVPTPGENRICVQVRACGLNPADWALCRGLFAGDLPRGIGLDVSGTVASVGEGVADVAVGDHVLGVADYVGSASAGASDYANLNYWTRVPEGLDLVEAAALPMAVETAFRSLAWLGVDKGNTLMVNGAGTMVGFAAVQMALIRKAQVIATAGDTFAERLRALGATVTTYGDGMVERVRKLVGGAPDFIFDAAPAGGVLPDLVEIAGGDPRRVLTCTDFAGAAALRARTGFGEDATGPDGAVLRWDVLGEFARLAAEGRFTVPIARTFPLEDWRQALDISLSGRAHGKLMLLPAG
jgi:NADPH:quinone reductase-like Zn-dependent oxidoreductase